jgi:hypothetical protein
MTRRVERPKDGANHTPAEREEQSKGLRVITTETLKERKYNRVRLRCGGKNHKQLSCLESQPKNMVAAAQPIRTIQSQKRKQEDLNIKEELAPSDEKKKAVAIISMGGAIYELEFKLMDVDE